MVFRVSKLFRAYGLYNELISKLKQTILIQFQSSFELTGYITELTKDDIVVCLEMFQSSFELTGYITVVCLEMKDGDVRGFKALSSLRVI